MEEEEIEALVQLEEVEDERREKLSLKLKEEEQFDKHDQDTPQQQEKNNTKEWQEDAEKLEENIDRQKKSKKNEEECRTRQGEEKEDTELELLKQKKEELKKEEEAWTMRQDVTLYPNSYWLTRIVFLRFLSFIYGR